MQPTYYSSRILQPVRPWFVVLTLFAALIINYLPRESWPWMPDFVALVLVFWSIREPHHAGMGYGFLLGLAMDVADASLMGQHALAYVLAAYAAFSVSRRILWFPLGQQALQVLPILVMVQLVQFVVRALSGADYPGWGYFAGPFIAALLWRPLTFILLLPQYQPVDRDANRPI